MDNLIYLRNYESRRVSILEGSRYGVLNGTILLRYIRWRRLVTNSETNTEVHEHTVQVLARGTPMSAMKRLATEMTAAALFSRGPYSHWRREALSANVTTCHDPERRRIRPSGVDRTYIIQQKPHDKWVVRNY